MVAGMRWSGANFQVVAGDRAIERHVRYRHSRTVSSSITAMPPLPQAITTQPWRARAVW